MVKVDEKKIHKEGRIPDSLFSYFTSQYVSRALVPLLIRLGIKNPNTVTMISFLLMISASVMLLLMDINTFLNRLVIAALIEISFIFDCADGQVARVLNKTSITGGWLDRYLDRIGEMALYSIIGWVSWFRYGSVLYFLAGILLGYMFTYYSLSYSIKDSIFLEVLVKEGEGEFIKPAEKSKKILGKRLLGRGKFVDILSKLFFFLNIGMGERYLYPIFFILIDRLDLMLIILTFLFTMRTINKNLMLFSRIKRNKIGVEL